MDGPTPAPGLLGRLLDVTAEECRALAAVIGDGDDQAREALSGPISALRAELDALERHLQEASRAG